MIVSSNWLSLSKIANSGQTFRWQKCTTHNDECYIIFDHGNQLHARQLDPNRVEFDCQISDWQNIWSKYFDMDTDYDLIPIDPNDSYLSSAYESARGLRLLKQDFWETTISFICSQNNNIPRINAIIANICKACGKFPDPSDIICIGSDGLSKCGLGYRLDYIITAANRFITDEPQKFIQNATYDESRKYLMGFKGIGPKVADCICLYALGHTGAFPRDVWVKRIERENYNGSFPTENYPGVAGILQLFMFVYERGRGG